MLVNHLPHQALAIADQQGWDDLSTGLQLLGFIQSNVPDYEEKLAAHFQAVANEENGEDDENGDGIEARIRAYLVGEADESAVVTRADYNDYAEAGGQELTYETWLESSVTSTLDEFTPADTIRSLIDDLARVTADDISEADLSEKIVTALRGLGYGDNPVVRSAQGRCERVTVVKEPAVGIIPEEIATNLAMLAETALEVFDGTSDTTDLDESIVNFCEAYDVQCDGFDDAFERQV